MSGNGIGGDLTQFERNKYFYGKLMTVRDFETEQSYFIEKQRLINRLIHGIGIVCGLEITEPRIDNGELKIKLSPGVALDCCGHEIVVGEEFIGKELEVKGTVTDGSNYTYLKYAECEKESVPVLANVSTCEEVCCYNRMEEVFELELGDSPDKDKVKVSGKVTESDGATTSIKGALVEALQNGIVKGITIANESGDYTLMLSPGTYDIRASASRYQSKKIENVSSALTNVDFQLIKETSPKDSKELWEDVPQEYYEEHLELCPECEDAKVLLTVIDYNKSAETLKINEVETYKYRAIVYNNPLLYELISSHIVDFNNPHRTTAEQVGALKSVDGVSNPGGDVDLEPESSSAITITPDDATNTITIGESHSKKIDNPHEVTAEQVGALKSVNGVNGDLAGDITLVEGDNIDIKPNPVNNEITISDTAVGGGTTGVIKVGVERNSAGVKEVSYGFTSEFPPMVSLGLVRDDDGVFMEDPILFLQKFDHLDISSDEREEILKELGLTNLPRIFFKAYDLVFDPKELKNNKFKILVVNLSGEEEFTIRWWAIPASKEILAGRDIVRIMDVIRDTHGEAIFEMIVAERNVPKEKVRYIINSMMVAIESKPEGITVGNLSKDVKLNEETVKPILETLEEKNILASTGTGARKRFILRR